MIESSFNTSILAQYIFCRMVILCPLDTFNLSGILREKFNFHRPVKDEEAIETQTNENSTMLNNEIVVKTETKRKLVDLKFRLKKF